MTALKSLKYRKNVGGLKQQSDPGKNLEKSPKKSKKNDFIWIIVFVFLQCFFQRRRVVEKHENRNVTKIQCSARIPQYNEPPRAAIHIQWESSQGESKSDHAMCWAFREPEQGGKGDTGLLFQTWVSWGRRVLKPRQPQLWTRGVIMGHYRKRDRSRKRGYGEVGCG